MISEPAGPVTGVVWPRIEKCDVAAGTLTQNAVTTAAKKWSELAMIAQWAVRKKMPAVFLCNARKVVKLHQPWYSFRDSPLHL